MIKSIKNNLLLFILLLLIIVFNYALVQFPLTNVFGYEFAALNAVLLSFLSAVYSVIHFKKYFKEEEKPKPFALLKVFSIFLLVPILISISNSFINGFCSFFDGLSFYIVLTVPAVIVGGSLALISISIFKRFNFLLVIILYLAILSITFFELLNNPQIYFFNPVFGFFPGTIYDEGLSVSSKLLNYRIINVLFFGSITLLLRKRIQEKKRNGIKLVFLFLLISAVFYYFSPQLGFSTTFNKLNSELPVIIGSKNFIIHSDKTIDEKELKIIVLYHEYYLKEIETYFEVKQTDKIQSYLFRDNDQKKDLFGSGNADVAKPWLNTIYVSITSWEHTLKHELAHCVSANFGTGLFELSGDLNPALIEGIAEAVDNSYDENEIHYLASLAFNNDYKEDILSTFSGLNFFASNSSLSYVFSGSFVRFLIHNYGITKFKEYYVTNDFENTYSIKLQQVTNEYYAFLKDYQSIYNEDQAHYYFGRRAIFGKVCARFISDRLSDGWNLYNENNFNGARRIFSQILDKTENYSALIGLAYCYEKVDSTDLAIELINDNLHHFEKTSYKFNLLLKLADLNAKLKNFNEAKQIYSEINKINPNRTLKYISELRLELANNKEKLLLYLNGSDFDKYSILQELNYREYQYFTFPVLINLSKNLSEDFDLFLEQFEKRFIVNDFNSSYGTYSLSKYMIHNFNFSLARKMAGLCMRYTEDKNYLQILKENYKMADWFYESADSILTNLKFSYYDGEQY